jgi:hypothetical protein
VNSRDAVLNLDSALASQFSVDNRGSFACVRSAGCTFGSGLVSFSLTDAASVVTTAGPLTLTALLIDIQLGSLDAAAGVSVTLDGRSVVGASAVVRAPWLVFRRAATTLAADAWQAMARTLEVTASASVTVVSSAPLALDTLRITSGASLSGALVVGNTASLESFTLLTGSLSFGPSSTAFVAGGTISANFTLQNDGALQFGCAPGATDSYIYAITVRGLVINNGQLLLLAHPSTNRMLGSGLVDQRGNMTVLGATRDARFDVSCALNNSGELRAIHRRLWLISRRMRQGP